MRTFTSPAFAAGANPASAAVSKRVLNIGLLLSELTYLNCRANAEMRITGGCGRMLCPV
jgi:hypothetical protein